LVWCKHSSLNHSKWTRNKKIWELQIKNHFVLKKTLYDFHMLCTLFLVCCSFVSGAELDNVEISLVLPLTLYICSKQTKKPERCRNIRLAACVWWNASLTYSSSNACFGGFFFCREEMITSGSDDSVLRIGWRAHESWFSERERSSFLGPIASWELLSGFHDIRLINLSGI
jgi:hypothetical protein